MRHYSFIFTLVFLTTCARAQYGINLRAGMGIITNPGNAAEPAPDLDISYNRWISPNIALGASIGYQKYVFNISDIGDYSAAPQTIIQLRQKSEYIFIAPVANIRLGKRVDLITGAGAGFLCNARQSIVYMRQSTYLVTSMHPYYNTVILPYEAKTSDNVNKLILRIQVGITEQITGEDAKFKVYLFQAFSYVPTYLSENKDANRKYTNENELKLTANFLSLGLGVSIDHTRSKKHPK